MLVGTAGIWQQAPVWALLYLAFGVVGVLGLVGPFLCAHCPYPTFFGDCLFLPYRMAKKVYRYRGPHMNMFEKIVSATVLFGMIVLPNIWLVRSPIWLVPFWVVALPFAVAVPVYYCRRCRYFGCPLNRVKGVVRKQTPVPGSKQ